MRTLGWLLLLAAVGLGLVTFLHVAGSLRVAPLSPEILVTVIPGLLIVGVVGIPGLLLVVFGKK